MLECKRCKHGLKANVAPVNHSRSLSSHKCTTEALKAACVRSCPRKQPRDSDAEVDSVGQLAKRLNTIAGFTVSAAQSRQFHRLFAIHIIKAEVPFEKVECPALK